MKQTISFTLVLTLVLSSYTPFLTQNSEAATTTFQFNRNLRQGETVDPDVKYLQQVLNSRSETRVAETGSGSNSQLSSYFGPKTRDAVIRFQNLYKTDILVPAGLSVGNGAVGPLTRKKLNETIGQLSTANLIYVSYATKVPDTAFSSNRPVDGTSSATTAGTFFPAPATQKSNSNNFPDGYVKITALSAYKAVPGQVVSIFGQGFSDESNIVFVGDKNVGAFNALDKATRITFTVPKVAKSGIYQIAVNNYFGTINSGSISLAIESDTPTVETVQGSNVVVNNGEVALISVNPKTSRNVNDVITLTGANFTAQNVIQTNLGNFTVASEDGRTIQFFAGSLPYYQKALDLYRGKSINVLIKVSNQNGLSTQLTHVIQFPDSTNPTINSTSQVNDSSLLTAQQGGSSATSSYRFTYNPYGDITPQGNTSADNSLAKYVGSFSNSNSNTSSNQQAASNQATSTNSSNLGPALALGAGAVGVAAVAGGVGAGAATQLAAAPFFGGKITAVLPCTCTGSTLLTIFDYTQKRPMFLMYVPGVSSLKANFELVPGVSTLGGFTRVTSMCWMAGPTVCNLYSYAEGTVDFIRGIGTSSI